MENVIYEVVRVYISKFPTNKTNQEQLEEKKKEKKLQILDGISIYIYIYIIMKAYTHTHFILPSEKMFN